MFDFPNSPGNELIKKIENIFVSGLEETVGKIENHVDTLNSSRSSKELIKNTLVKEADSSLCNYLNVFHENAKNIVYVDPKLLKKQPVVDKSNSSSVQELKNQLSKELNYNKELLKDIERGKKHLERLSNYIAIVESSENPASEEILLENLRSS